MSNARNSDATIRFQIVASFEIVSVKFEFQRVKLQCPRLAVEADVQEAARARAARRGDGLHFDVLRLKFGEELALLALELLERRVHRRQLVRVVLFVERDEAFTMGLRPLRRRHANAIVCQRGSAFPWNFR